MAHLEETINTSYASMKESLIKEKRYGESLLSMDRDL